MNKINNKVAEIHTALMDIIGEVIKHDLSGDQINKIQDKKSDCVKALFVLKDTISDFIK